MLTLLLIFGPTLPRSITRHLGRSRRPGLPNRCLLGITSPNLLVHANCQDGVVVLVGIRLGIDGVNPVYYVTIKVCDPFIFFHVRSIDINMKALYTFLPSVCIAGGRPSSSYYLVGSQADNLFYLDPRHTRATIPLRPPTQTSDRERGIPIRQVMPERGSVSPPGHHRSPTSPVSSRTGSSTFSYPTASPSPLSKQLSTSSSSSGGAHVRWNSVGANGAGGSELSGGASDVGLDATQMHYVTSYSAAELRTFHCERVRNIPLSGLDPSILIGFLCKTEADWIDLRSRVAEVRSVQYFKKRRNTNLGGPQLFKNHKTIFSIVDEPPSWPDADDSLESMSDPEEEDDIPDDKDSLSRSGLGDGTWMWTWTRAKTRRKKTFSMLAKAQSSAIGPCAPHQRAAKAVTAQRTIL
jgi:cysteine protease ATG4